MITWRNLKPDPVYIDPEHVWVFTFGFSHTDPATGESLEDCYTCVRGTYLVARERMVARFGMCWAFQYKSLEAAGVERYGLREVPFE